MAEVRRTFKKPDPIAPQRSSHAQRWSEMGAEWLRSWRDVFQKRTLVSDVLAGITVAAVALPLNVGLALASGLDAQAGLIAGAVGGMFAGAFGGARLQVTGPAAAISTLVLAIAKDFGATGVAAACLMVGVILLLLSAIGAGKLATYVPESVLAGFTTGVGIKLLDQQVPELFGFPEIEETSEHAYRLIDMAVMMHRPHWLHDVSWNAVVCGLMVAFLMVTTKQYKRFPSAIVGLALVTSLAAFLHWDVPRVPPFSGEVPVPKLPLVEDQQWLDLLIATTPLALLAGIESLLSAKALDRMVDDMPPHNPHLELFGQGLANFVVGLVGGLPVTGVVVRSGVNAQSGARTRLAAIVHGVVLLLAVMFLASLIAHAPMAGLAGLLCVVGIRLIELRTLLHLWDEAKPQALAFLIACAGTVSGRLMLGLAVGLAVSLIDSYVKKRLAGPQAPERSELERASLGKERATARATNIWEPLPEHHQWLRHVDSPVHAPSSSFVHEQASVEGKVVLGEFVHVAAGSSVRADEGAPFFLGANTNVQDGVVIHALKDKYVQVSGERWAVYVGANVSLAHNALIHGPSYIGDNSFVGFKAIVHDAVIGAGCFIGHGAIVVGVDVPDDRYVPNGAIIDTADKVARLGPATHAHHEFNEDVVEVNRGLAEAYREHRARLATATTPLLAETPLRAAIGKERF